MNKHIVVKYNYIYEMIGNNEITVDCMSTNDIIPVSMIKIISDDLFLKHAAHMWLKYL